MPSCVVKKCDYKKSYKEAKAKGLKFQSFPLPKEPPELRELWLKKLNVVDFKPTSNTYFCQKHFAPEAFIADEDNKTTRGGEKLRKNLKHLAYPTLHMRPKKIAKARKTKNSSKTEITEDKEKKQIKEIAAIEEIMAVEDINTGDEHLAAVEDINTGEEHLAAVEDINTSDEHLAATENMDVENANTSIEHDHSYGKIEQPKEKAKQVEKQKVFFIRLERNFGTSTFES